MTTKDHPNNAPGVPMKFPVWFENFQIKYLNPIISADRQVPPGMTVITHRGRTSGTAYETGVRLPQGRHRGDHADRTARPTGSRTFWPPVKPISASAGDDLHLVNPRVRAGRHRRPGAAADGPWPQRGAGSARSPPTSP